VQGSAAAAVRVRRATISGGGEYGLVNWVEGVEMNEVIRGTRILVCKRPEGAVCFR
jgi:hypothetical protein